MLLGRRYRHFKRLERIVSVIWRYGFGYIVDQTGIAGYFKIRRRKLEKDNEKIAVLSRGERLRLAFTELGPTFIKLGQILSTRHELLPEDITSSLQKLQDEVSPFDFAEVRKQVEGEFHMPLEETFASFEREPLASASIGQVHSARLPSGKEVVVKVQRPGVQRMIETDLEILFDLARFIEKRTSWGKVYGLQEMIEEFSNTIKREIDYTIEGRNADRIRRNLANEEENVYVPEIFWDHTSHRILTMEHVKGTKLSNLPDMHKAGINREEVARILASSMVRQILIHGFFHADPHPGNVLIMPDGRLALLDFGMVSSLTEEQRNFFINLIFAIIRGNSREITQSILEKGATFEEVDERKLRTEVERLREKYYDLPLKDLKLGDSIRELHKLAYNYKIRFPADFTLVSKALLTLEGTIAYLSPRISFLEIVEPMGQQLIRRRFSRRQLQKWLMEDLPSYGEMMLEIPERLHSLLGKLEKNQSRLKLEFTETNKVLGRMDRISNRLSFSVVLLSFSIIMAGLLVSISIRDVPLFGGNLPVVELGFVTAGALALWLLMSIIRSGRF